MRKNKWSTKVGGALSILMIVALMMLTACGSNNSASPSPSAEATKTGNTESPKAVPSKEPVTLKLMATSDWINDTWKKIFANYEAKTGTKIDVQTIPGGDKLKELVLTRIATQDFPDVLFYFSTGNAIKELQPGNLVDLSNESYISRINPAIQKYYLKLDGKTYGVPVSGMNVSGVIYNKKVFKDLGIAIPQTYDQLMAAAEKIKTAGITPFYEAGKDAWPLQMFTLSGFTNVIKKQPDVMDKLNTHQVTFDQVPNFVDLLQKQMDLKTKGYLNSDLFSATYDISQDQLATGKAAMLFQADWAIPIILKKYPDAPFGMFPLPLDGDNYAGISDPQAAYVFKNTKNVEEAKKFIAYLTEPDTLKTYYSEQKTIPTWTGVDVELNPGTAEMKSYVEAGKATPFFNGLTNVTINPYPPLLQEMYGGKKTPVEVAKAVQANMDKAAKAAGIKGW